MPAIEHGHSVPVTTTLSILAPTCSRRGDPRFVVTITHHSTAPRPIWALVYRFTEWCSGIEIRDLEHHRRQGPSPLWTAYAQVDEDPDPREDTLLERLAPEQSLDVTYILPSLGRSLAPSKATYTSWRMGSATKSLCASRSGGGCTRMRCRQTARGMGSGAGCWASRTVARGSRSA